MNDITIRTMEEERKLPYSELTGSILNCCFEVMKELGPGFLERVYKNGLAIAMKQKGLQVYPNNLKSWELDKEAPHISRLERAAFVRDKGPSENEKFGDKPTPSKTNFSSCLGITERKMS